MNRPLTVRPAGDCLGAVHEVAFGKLLFLRFHIWICNPPPLLSPPTPPPSFLDPFVHGFQGHWPGQLQGQWPVNGGGNAVFIA